MTREDFERQFYERWNTYIPTMSIQQLQGLNADKLGDVTASHPNTMLWLKDRVLHELAARGSCTR